LTSLIVGIHVVKADLTYDLNGDGRVDIRDLTEASKAFGTLPQEPRWNAKSDLNNDGKVDIVDFAMVADHFGDAVVVLVVPEFWMGPALGITGCIAAFGLYRYTKTRKLA